MKVKKKNCVGYMMSIYILNLDGCIIYIGLPQCENGDSTVGDHRGFPVPDVHEGFWHSHSAPAPL